MASIYQSSAREVIFFAKTEHMVETNISLCYQSTQSFSANIDDKIVLGFADKAKEEMQTTLRIIKQVINILRSQIKINP